MLKSQSNKALKENTFIIYYKFIKNNFCFIEKIYELFKIDKTVDFQTSKLALGFAKNIWEEFIHEPNTTLDISLLKKSRSAIAYALRTLYEHMSKHLMRPNQGEILIDQDIIQSILKFLVYTFHNPEFISKMDYARRSHQKTRSSIYTYASNLKQIYAKLMVLRVDLGYNRFISKTDSPSQRIETDWEQLLQYVKINFINSFAGYGVKFEHGEDKGLHAHSVFFFDGNVVCNDAKIGRILGEYWENQVTQGLGVYFNCNTSNHKAMLNICSLGTFTGKEQAFWDGMWIVADYLSKPDVMVRLILAQGAKTFRRGSLSEKQKIKLETVLKKQTMHTNNLLYSDRYL